MRLCGLFIDFVIVLQRKPYVEEVLEFECPIIGIGRSEDQRLEPGFRQRGLLAGTELDACLRDWGNERSGVAAAGNIAKEF